MKQHKLVAGVLTGAFVIFVAVALLVGGIGGDSGSASTPNLGAFNPSVGSNPSAEVSPLGEIGPGACWPGGSFNNPKGQSEAVTFLSGQNPKDTLHLATGVANRYNTWFVAHRDYYGYTGNSGADVATWLRDKTVFVQLTSSITVQNHYCPSGQDTVLPWKAQTFQAGEWVVFLSGHAPGDSGDLRPVIRASCGNPLLPPPVPTTPNSPASPTSPSTPHSPPTPPPTSPPVTTVPPTTTSPPVTTVPPTTTSKPPLSYNCQQNSVGCPSGFSNPVVQSPQNNTASGVYVGPTAGAPTAEPPPATSSNPATGISGSGDAGTATGSTDNTSSGSQTTVDNQPTCPFGPGNC